MPDVGGGELLREWRKLMDSMVAAASSVGGRAELPSQLLQPMQRQLELVQEVIERERRLQQQLTSRVLEPFDAIFDLLESSGQTLRRQAEALEEAGRSLEQTAGLVRTQAEMFERTIAALRQPADLARAATGLERRTSKRGSTGPSRSRSS
ncbi:MAG: hypothetical protein JO153_17840 [Solirubrobacterales bacterium]|nr:hypothetical protein [Solirubrobacterales bacterium]MBV9918364.1 hypothetical protein [Solirubrobacterales bacterium]